MPTTPASPATPTSEPPARRTCDLCSEAPLPAEDGERCFVEQQRGNFCPRALRVLKKNAHGEIEPNRDRTDFLIKLRAAKA